jgi:hypothetical protein
MARKPNYNFERKERDRAKSEKLAAKAEAKKAEKALAEQGAAGLVLDESPSDALEADLDA